MRFYNSLLNCNSELLKKVWRANREMCGHPGAKNCWTAEFLDAFHGSQGEEQYKQAMLSGSDINIKEFAVHLRARLCKVWIELGDTEPRECRLKCAAIRTLCSLLGVYLSLLQSSDKRSCTPISYMFLIFELGIGCRLFQASSEIPLEYIEMLPYPLPHGHGFESWVEHSLQASSKLPLRCP